MHKFFQQALGTDAEFALNVWAMPAPMPPPTSKLSTVVPQSNTLARWRWQLLRLQDGKADEQEGTLTEAASPALAEIYAALHGLQDLRGRIERAGRQPSQYSIELRCFHLAAALPELRLENATLAQEWEAAQARWRAIYLRPLPPTEA